MNQLRQLMLEELHRRNFADTTIRTYLHGVEHFSRYFRRRPISSVLRTYASIRRSVRPVQVQPEHGHPAASVAALLLH